jgi:hypothetical protein
MDQEAWTKKQWDAAWTAFLANDGKDRDIQLEFALTAYEQARECPHVEPAKLARPVAAHVAEWLQRHGWAKEGVYDVLVSCIETALATYGARPQANKTPTAQEWAAMNAPPPELAVEEPAKPQVTLEALAKQVARHERALRAVGRMLDKSSWNDVHSCTLQDALDTDHAEAGKGEM